MRTDPALRQRHGSQPVASLSPSSGVVGVLAPPKPRFSVSRVPGMQRILNGLFGTGSPQNNASAEVPLPGPKALYHFHEGDLFTPGTGNYVFESPFELPMNTIWGHGFARQPNVFNPLQPSPLYSGPTVKIAGIGGLIAGQMALQPLESTGD